MRILILGGSPNHLGGVETFGDRAEAALRQYAPDIKIERLWTETAYLTLRRIPKIFVGIKRLVLSRKGGPAIVWLQYVNFPDLIYLFSAKLIGFRVVVTPHLGTNWASQRQPMLRALSRAVLSMADRIAIISKTQLTEVALPDRTQINLIRTYLPREAFDSTVISPRRSDRLHLVHASRLSEAKGTFKVIEVLHRLRIAGVAFTAEIIGSADQATLDTLSKLIIDCKLEEIVSVPGWMPPDELISRLRDADILIHLSKTDSYPLIVLESLACATLPLVLDLPGAKDIVQAYDGWVVPAGTVIDDTVDAISKSIPADIRRRGQLQSDRVRGDFAWKEAVALLMSVMTQVDDLSVKGLK